MADANKRILQSALLIVALGLVSTGARAQPGGATPSAGQQSAAPAHPPTSRQCEDCHAPRSVPTVDARVLAHSVHAKLDCTDCHSDINTIPHPHKLEPVDCSGCHRRIAHQLRSGGHAPAKDKTKSRAPSCASCHGSHDVAKTNSAAFRNAIPGRCAACHEERYEGYMDRFHGQAAALGMAKAPRCSDCHNPHRPLPPDDSKSRVAPANLVATCGACHKKANTNFTQFDPHPQPSNKAHSALVYYCNLLMQWLLIGVFGFFGLHTVLWLQRSCVAYLRKELPRPLAASGQYVLRFSIFDRWMHIIVILSFILLAMTGLPLKYASASWAHWLSALFGGEPAMRNVHLICGAITFGYFFVHLGVVAWHFIRSRDWHLFYGPNSMVPRWKDVVDITRNFAWFLYLGPRPELGRWTYWEKFDYWAVFWGVAMIGVSGLMLAMPEQAARLLPGQLLNVAAVVHGEEALLAVGFIFVFHYFHNHLRPENFPMDVTIFTGRLSLERFRQERPEQYATLVSQNRLESVLVGPPSRRLVVISTIFGTFVVVLGLLLIIAVFATIIGT